MKLWKEILIQYALIIGIFNIIVYTDNYGGASNYYFLVFPMLAYMILMPGINDLINKSNKTLLKNYSKNNFTLIFWWVCTSWFFC